LGRLRQEDWIESKKKKKTKTKNNQREPAWLTPVILVTLEAEIRRIMVQSQAEQTVCEVLWFKW
jgi:hypothetical protein